METEPTYQHDAAHKGSKKPRAEITALINLLVCALILRLPFFGDLNADIDEQLYDLIGSYMLQGQLPFVDLWDRKPFGLFALYALADATGLPSPWSYQLLAWLFTVLGAWLLRILCLDIVDRVTATVVAVLYMMLLSNYGSHSGQSEIFFLPAVLGMAVLVRDTQHPDAVRRAIWAMLLGGLALQIKYTVLPQCLFFGAWVLWGQYRANRSIPKLIQLALLFALLGLVPTIAVALLYAGLGHAHEFWFANFVSFFDRAPSPTGRFVAEHFLFISPLIILSAGGVYSATRIKPPSEWATYLFFVMFLIASIATTYIPSTIYGYYFAALVPGALLVALPLLDRRSPLRYGPITVALLVSYATLFYPQKLEESARQKSAMARLVNAIEPHIDDRTQCLWVYDGPTALYRATGSCLPTGFIYPDHLNNALERDALGIAQIDEVRRILGNRPPVIVTAGRAFTIQNEEVMDLVNATLSQGYRRDISEQISTREIIVWLRNDLANDTRPSSEE